jgi:hypothetical protein
MTSIPLPVWYRIPDKEPNGPYLKLEFAFPDKNGLGDNIAETAQSAFERRFSVSLRYLVIPTVTILFGNKYVKCAFIVQSKNERTLLDMIDPASNSNNNKPKTGSELERWVNEVRYFPYI